MNQTEILEWARSRGILDKGNILVQTIKLQEEVGELAKAVLFKSKEEIDDAIGDIVIVLTSLSYFNGSDIESNITKALGVVKKRKGQMKDGNFVKSTGRKKKEMSSEWRERRRVNIERVKQIAEGLDVAQKTRKYEIMTLRTCLVFFLREYYSGPLIAEAFEWDSSTVVGCVKRYRNLKHYPDWQEATNFVIQYLRQYSLGDSLR